MAPHPHHSPSRDQKLDEARADRPRVSASDPVGRFHVARQRVGRPIAVSAWRITTEDRAVADAVGGLYGGVPKVLDTGGEHVLEVLTRREHIPVSLGSRGAVSLRMVMRGAGETFHVCDGTRFLEPAGVRGSLCGCPASLADRKAAAQAGRGRRRRSDSASGWRTFPSWVCSPSYRRHGSSLASCLRWLPPWTRRLFRPWAYCGANWWSSPRAQGSPSATGDRSLRSAGPRFSPRMLYDLRRDAGPMVVGVVRVRPRI